MWCAPENIHWCTICETIESNAPTVWNAITLREKGGQTVSKERVDKIEKKGKKKISKKWGKRK